MNELNNVTEDSILIFEYFTASGIDDPLIISEACEIIKSLAFELKDKDTYVLVSNNFKNIFDDIFEEYESSNLKVIAIDWDNDDVTSLEDWLSVNGKFFSKAMFIAAENNMNLYNLTKILEKNDVKVYGCDSYAVKMSSDKYMTFDYFYGKLKQPQTFNILINNKTYWKRAIQIFFDKINGDYGDESTNDAIPIMQKPKDIPILDNSNKDLIKDKKLIAKPRCGVDCESIKLIKSKVDIDELEEIYPLGSRFIVQEFIEGTIASVSLICDGKTAIPISLNKQIIKIDDNGGEYIGGEIPFEHPLKDKAFDFAKKACEYVPGIKGFVGVDIVLNEEESEVYLIEINSRFTTSYVGLSKIADFNIAESIIDLLDENLSVEEIIDKINYNGKISFLKDENGILNIKKV